MKAACWGTQIFTHLFLIVGRDQHRGRYKEVYGESPYLVAELGVEMALGLQENYQVAAISKHSIVYSNNIRNERRHIAS